MTFILTSCSGIDAAWPQGNTRELRATVKRLTWHAASQSHAMMPVLIPLAQGLIPSVVILTCQHAWPLKNT